MVVAEQHEDDITVLVLHEQGNLLLAGLLRFLSVQLALNEYKLVVDLELSAGIEVDLLADFVLEGEVGRQVEQ